MNNTGKGENMTEAKDNRFRQWIFLPAMIFCIAFPIVAKVHPPEGDMGSDALRLVGRLHMLALHMPIGLLLTLPVLELLGLMPRFKGVKEATPWVLGFGTLGAIVAAIMGYLLATHDGYTPSKLLSTHMWGGIVVACLSTLAFCAKIQIGKPWGRVYGAFLTLICVVLPLTAHEGGSLTHGANYLTFFLNPQPASKLAELEQGVFTKEIHPIFEKHCIVCHGAEKSKGGLRLDSYAELKKASVMLLNKENSELIRRITLPPDDPEAMPPDGKNPLTPQEIETVKNWVNSGAVE